MPSAYLQWRFHSGEVVVARGSFFFFFLVGGGGGGGGRVCFFLSFFITSCSCSKFCLFNPISQFYYRNDWYTLAKTV